MAEKVSYNFVGKRNQDPVNKQRLEYPQGRLFDNHTDYVRFNFVKYRPPFASVKGYSNKTINNKGQAKPGAQAVNIYNNSIGEFQSAGLPKIFMYMPEDLGAEYGAEWGGKGFTNTGASIMRGAGALGNSNDLGTSLGTIGEGFSKFMKNGPSLMADAISTALGALPGKVGGDIGINDVLGGIGGVILNPNVELLFTGFELRTFGLNFKMSPRNEKEARHIRDICTTFKRAALPRLGASPGNTFNNATKNGEGTAEENNNSNFIGVPNLCIVEFMKGPDVHPFLSQFKPCAITNVGVSYTPDGNYATFEDGSPVATQLTLQFTETKLVYSNEISYGDQGSY